MLKKLQHIKIYPQSVKTSATVTAVILQQLFKQALNTGEFRSNLKNADVTHGFKKKFPLNKEITDRLVFYLLFQKYLKS